MKHYEFKVILKAGKYEDSRAAMDDIRNALDDLVDDEIIGDYEILTVTEAAPQEWADEL